MTAVHLFACGLVAGALVVVTAGKSAAPVTVVSLPDGGIQPQAVSDPTGTIHVLYFKGEAAHGDLFYATLDNAGTFSSPIRVNSTPGAAVATGTMRGGHLALGRNNRVHVAWHGSDRAHPRAPGGATPVMYTRLNDAGTAFEREHTVVSRRLKGLDAGTVAADRAGRVYIAWHAFLPGTRGEADRRVWIARSRDDGATFDPEEPASDAATGACGCCGVGAFADSRGWLYVLYRSARDDVHRDTYLLRSRDSGATFTSQLMQEWHVGACPMSSFSISENAAGVAAAWETANQVYWLPVKDGDVVAPIAAPGAGKTRKHPSVAGNARGETILVWTEGTSWNRGGDLAWQVFDANGRPQGALGHAPGIPAWGLATAAAREDGSFVIVR